MPVKGIYRKIFHPFQGLSVKRYIFLQRCHPLPGVFCKHHPSGGSPLATGSFPWRRDGENADDLCDGIAKIIEPLWGSTSRKMPFFSAVTLRNEVSRNHTNHDWNGEQVPNRRFMMTGNCGTLSYRFFTYRSESDIPKRDSERSEESIFLFL